LFVLLLVAGIPTYAAGADTKVGVSLQFSGKDALGKQLDFFLKEQFRQSATFQEVYDEKGGIFVVYLTTIDPSVNADGYQTVYSYVLAVENKDGLNSYLKSVVGVCGGNRIRECANDLFGDVGSALGDIRRALLAETAASNP
jgi:hypothetical protein